MGMWVQIEKKGNLHMAYKIENIQTVLSPEKLQCLFPPDRTDQFFEALLGDAREGAFDIRLTYDHCEPDRLALNFELHQRTGKCLACHLTHGLPGVFERHPVISIQALVDEIEQLMNGIARCREWTVGATREITPQLHIVPLFINLAAD